MLIILLLLKAVVILISLSLYFSLEGSSQQLKVELERSPKQQEMERCVHIHLYAGVSVFHLLWIF